MCPRVSCYQASEQSGTKDLPGQKHQPNDDHSGEPAAKKPHGRVYLGCHLEMNSFHLSFAVLLHVQNLKRLLMRRICLLVDKENDTSSMTATTQELEAAGAKKTHDR